MNPDDKQQLNVSTSTVRDAFDVLGQHSHTVVPSSADFGAMVRLLTPHPEIRLVMVVDDNRMLVGIIPIRTIYDAMFTDIYPAAALGDVASVEEAMDVGDQIVHPTAGELMIEPNSVDLNDTLHDAFIKIHRTGVSCIAVVDNGKPVGYLDCMAIVPLWEQHTPN